ncbi:hypothetical protein ACQP3D_26970, partial [Escherichia coli]
MNCKALIFFRFGWGDTISFWQGKARQCQARHGFPLDLFADIESHLGKERQGKARHECSLDLVAL